MAKNKTKENKETIPVDDYLRAQIIAGAGTMLVIPGDNELIAYGPTAEKLAEYFELETTTVTITIPMVKMKTEDYLDIALQLESGEIAAMIKRTSQPKSKEVMEKVEELKGAYTN